MEYYISQNGKLTGNGSKETPFNTIGQAAKIAKAGDTVIIGEGIYREWVNPTNGGASNDKRITYIAAAGEKPVISGAEEVTGWEKVREGVWKTTVANEIFSDYNPFANLLFGEWYTVVDFDKHMGELYLNGHAMYETPTLEALMSANDTGEKAYKWFAVVSKKTTEIWGRFNEINPNEHSIEVNARKYCFFPEKEGLNYITLSGLIFENAAPQWAPPTAFQEGAVGTHWSKGWVVENCIIRNAKCSGLSLGKHLDECDHTKEISVEKGGTQVYTELVLLNVKNGWSKDYVGSHMIRNNEIHHCGQTAIVGCMGGAFSTIIGNHIHDICNRHEMDGAENSGIKLHAAIDTLIENNCIHNCFRGLWLDWEAQGARVSRNSFFNNMDQDLFIEVCHGPCIVDNNLFLSDYNFLNVSQGTALINNLFAGKNCMVRDISRFSLYHFPHDTHVSGVMLIYGGDDKILGNIYVGNNKDFSLISSDIERKKQWKISYGNCAYNGYNDVNASVLLERSDMPQQLTEATLSVNIDHNLYFNGAGAYENEQHSPKVNDFNVELSISEDDGDYYLITNLPDFGFEQNVNIVTTNLLGRSFQSGCVYENGDGTALIIDTDFCGNKRNGDKTYAGPFASFASRVLLNKRI